MIKQYAAGERQDAFVADGLNIRGDICFGEVGEAAGGGNWGQPAPGA